VSAVLELRDVSTILGNVKVLRGISMNIKAGEVVALLGRNGAGKTTTMKTILGLVKPVGGSIMFNGKNITGWSTQEIVKLGIGYAPEDRRIYPEHTVEENIKIALWMSSLGDDFMETIFYLFPELKELMRRKGRHLSGGQQKMLAVARALPLARHLLLLDEPLEGLSPALVRMFAEKIKAIRDRQRISILVAEANAYNAMRVADRIYVIERGEIVFEGDSESLRSNEKLLKSLLMA